jgi:uncharacterized membrane protein
MYKWALKHYKKKKNKQLIKIMLLEKTFKSLEEIPKYDNLYKQNFLFKKFGIMGECNFESPKYNTRFFANFPFVIVASLVAYIGLAKNDSTIIIASMLFSPLGSQIIRSAFGIMNHNGEQFSIGLVNHLLYVLLIFFIGFGLGLILDEKSTMGAIDDKKNANKEMLGRGTWTDSIQNIIFAVFLASLSGILLAIASQKEDSSVMVGIGIGASLLPPLVNSGMFAAFAAKGDKKYNYLQLSVKSFGLWLLNFVIVIISMLITFYFGCKIGIVGKIAKID